MAATATAEVLDGAQGRPEGLEAWYRNYHRYYDPATGRYTQIDPAWRPIAIPGWSGTHLYSYVESDPLSFIDPTGLYLTSDDCLKSCGRRVFPGPAVRSVSCAPLPQKPTNKALWACIARQCQNAVVTCSSEACMQQRDSGFGMADQGTVGAGGTLTRQGTWVNLCSRDLNKCSQRQFDDVVIHEFAHTCGWQANGKGGIQDPTVPGAATDSFPTCGY